MAGRGAPDARGGWFLLFICFIWFVWLNYTNRMNKINQINPSRTSCVSRSQFPLMNNAG